ncbi:MAG: DUF6079 family protein [Acidimicrobiia bacterium]
MSGPSLGELVEVADVETVVRLDGTGGRLAQLVLTGDVAASLVAVLDAAAGDTGAGFFVVGPFGSGKSHFLAAVGEVLSRSAAPSAEADWEGALRERAEAARPSLAVAVPLVEYRARAALEDVLAERAWRALGRELPEAEEGDRAATWDAVVAAARAAGHAGVVLLLDELSEFLRAKQGPALTEDLRFLQFLGEWARTRPVLVLGALQESIEEVANVSQRELARIRDRYGPSLTLSMRHVEDLVRGRLVRLRPGAERWVDQAWAETAAAFPASGVDRDRFARSWPLHPGTLSVLEGLRFLLSQQRGVVDFVCRRLRDGLGRGYAELVTPDEVFDHFRGRLLERNESSRLADTVGPYYARAVDELVDPADRELALRAVKLLCLLAASPLERPRTAGELAFLLLARVSDLDPAANAAYLEQAVLEPLVDRGAYVVAKPGPPTAYAVEPEADAALVVATRVAQARAEVAPGDRRLVATLVALGSSSVLPLQLLGEVGASRREILWQNTLRTVVVSTARILELTPDEAVRLVDQARSAGAAGCILVGEVELQEAAEAAERAASLVAAGDRLAVWVPDVLRPDERQALLAVHARRLVLAAAEAEGRDDLADVVRRGADADVAVAREILRRAYFEGTVRYPHAGAGIDLPSLAGLAFERQLPRLADPLLSGLHPLHREVAPRAELVGDRLLRQVLQDVVSVGRLGPGAVERGRLRPLVEGYLVPLGLARLRRDGATVAPDPARSPAVAEALRLAGDGGPVPAGGVVAGLGDGPVGLSEPEVLLVLNACVQAGLLEGWRGRRRLEVPFLTVAPTDRLGPGELVEPATRAAMAPLAPLFGPGPFEPWTAGTQRSAWEYAKAWLEARREDLAQVRAGLARFGDVPALAAADAGPVLEDVSLIEGVLDACPPSPAAAAGLRRLVGAAADPAAVLAAARRLGSVARFARDELRRVEEAAASLTHPDLTIPAGHEALAALRDRALDLVRGALPVAAEDRVGDLFAANREFRAAYVAAYQEAHDRHYGAVGPAAVEELRAEPAYRALARLAAIGAVAVPDDRVKVDRMLAGAVPTPCRRPLEVELAWRPRCACGLALGDREPALDRQAVLAVAARGVRQYLDELARPELRDRLEDAAADLATLGRAELAADLRRLVALAGQPPGAVDPAEVAGVLDGDLAGVVRDVLTGAQLIVTRDLAVLREDLIGRRYPKRRLLELVATWVDGDAEVPPGGFVEVVDTADTGPRRAAPPPPGAPPGPAGGATVALLRERFPGVAAALPAHEPADAFWLAAWWGGRPAPPPWLPADLLADPERLGSAARSLVADPGAVAELAALDRRVTERSVLGDQMAAALDLGSRPVAEVAVVLGGERLLRHPLRLAAGQLVRHLAADWQLAAGLDDVRRLAAGHALVDDPEVAALVHVVDAARHLAAVERRLAGLPLPSLVADVYPSHCAPVPELVSRAALACAGGGLVDPEAVEAFRAGAARLLRSVDEVFRAGAADDFAGCLRVWEVGEAVVGPLLEAHGRVAVLVVDAMRADLAAHVVPLVAEALPGRPVHRRWAVVPAPTRTAEAVAALASGRPVPAGSAPAAAGPVAVPFAHLGFEADLLLGADRDDRTSDLRTLLGSGPPLSVAVAGGVDERLHRTSVELAALLDEAVTALRRRVVPALTALPGDVPLVVLADHGFRENPHWGHGPDGRYVHGGTSLEECVAPVLVFAPAPPAPA